MSWFNNGNRAIAGFLAGFGNYRQQCKHQHTESMTELEYARKTTKTHCLTGCRMSGTTHPKTSKPLKSTDSAKRPIIRTRAKHFPGTLTFAAEERFKQYLHGLLREKVLSTRQAQSLTHNVEQDHELRHLSVPKRAVLRYRRPKPELSTYLALPNPCRRDFMVSAP